VAILVFFRLSFLRRSFPLSSHCLSFPFRFFLAFALWKRNGSWGALGGPLGPFEAPLGPFTCRYSRFLQFVFLLLCISFPLSFFCVALVLWKETASEELLGPLGSPLGPLGALLGFMFWPCTSFDSRFLSFAFPLSFLSVVAPSLLAFSCFSVVEWNVQWPRQCSHLGPQEAKSILGVTFVMGSGFHAKKTKRAAKDRTSTYKWASFAGSAQTWNAKFEIWTGKWGSFGLRSLPPFFFGLLVFLFCCGVVLSVVVFGAVFVFVLSCFVSREVFGFF
jgi:hypothetical protein